jgi:hypothetical protein
MSALGQKQTFALQNVMSALLLKADMSWAQSGNGSYELSRRRRRTKRLTRRIMKPMPAIATTA